MGVCAAYGHILGLRRPVNIIQGLVLRGSSFITRLAVTHWVAKDLEYAAQSLFNAIENGVVDATISYEYPLKNSVNAYKAIETRKTLS